MIGALVGLPNKQKAHRSLFKNILNLNKHLRPHLHIVDGLIAMEGNGPSSGTPLNIGVILIGTDPYLVDLACARIAGFDYRAVAYLKIALDTGIIGEFYLKYLDSFVPESAIRKLRKPDVNWLVRFINSPKRQHYFVKIRLAPGLNRLFSTRLAGKLLNISGLRQDVFIKEDALCNRLSLIEQECANCMKCADYCPMMLSLPQELKENNSRCIGCLYCFLVCPRKAIKAEGELGFICEQIKRYDKITRSIT
jgi:Pyruvate/2-oxoacid:ferredoxin oxidoreductase delta subunit